MELTWIHIFILGLFISELSLLNKKCEDVLIISISSLLICSILYPTYIIAFIKNRIQPLEDIITESDNRNYIVKYQNYKSLIDAFNTKIWIIYQDIKCYKSHSYIFIDFRQDKINYLYFSLFKNFYVGLITVIELNIKFSYNIKNILFSFIWFIYLIDILLLLLYGPYKNKFINTINLFLELSKISIISLIIFSNDDKYIMYVLDSTIIFMCFTIFLELFLNLLNLINSLIH
jgi:hypothetical protein